MKLQQSFFFLIFAILGSLLRWRLNNNLATNFLGTFLFGILFGLQVTRKTNLILGVAFCGSLTTFSGLMLDCFLLIITGLWLQCIKLIIFSLLFSLLSVAFGYCLGFQLKKLMQLQ